MKACLWSTNNGKLARLLMDIKDTGKVPNQKMAESQIVLVLVKIFALV